MCNMTNPPFQLSQSHHLWFEIFDKPFEDGYNATFAINYDYETLPDDTKWVYIDLSIKQHYCSVDYRSGFKISDNDLTWKDIFVFDMIKPMLQIAFAETLKGYIQFCEVNKLELPARAEFPESLIEPFANSIIEKYILYRSVSDEQNDDLINVVTLDAEPGSNIYSIFIYTFEILHEVLFYNPSFNRENNRNVFAEVIPMSRYFTLKYKCKGIERGDITMNGVDMVFFFQCLDCALQMIVGDKAYQIITALEPRGFSGETHVEFIRSGTEEINNFKSLLKQYNARILNLEDHIDWMKLLN